MKIPLPSISPYGLWPSTLEAPRSPRIPLEDRPPRPRDRSLNGKARRRARKAA